MKGPAEQVGQVQRKESVKALVEETKALAWVNNAEHPIIRLSTGERWIIHGGPDGIEFLVNQEETEVFVTINGLRVQVVRIYFHTHPRVTGPSADDLAVLKIFRQSRS